MARKAGDMARASWRGTIIAIVTLGSAHLNGSAETPKPSVVVLVDDRAQVAPEILEQALKEATRIYLHTSLRLVRRAPSHDPAANDFLTGSFTVHLIIQPKLLGVPERGARFQMGATPRSARECGGTTYIFYDQLTGFANVHRLAPALVLGTVAAHEIGHVLLGNSGHSPQGLMRGPWQPSDWEQATAGSLLFSAGDGSRARNAVATCQSEG
jgi:hypothetical protein